ncbi:MAG: hypothetical protein ACK44O_06965 [Novosphingobium sp.]|jgi:hypothetical protein|uniref:hypothetical protein n=1 Tax=Novosphingobium sp. TaxID=1874826 RepID=UPI00391B99A7|nr:hypothetical protein [Novosphingobium sp.]
MKTKLKTALLCSFGLSLWTVLLWSAGKGLLTGVINGRNGDIHLSEAPVIFTVVLIAYVWTWLVLTYVFVDAYRRRGMDKIDLQRRLNNPGFEDPSKRSKP